MADLHQKLLEDLRLRGLSAGTSTVYLNCINRFGRFFDASPDTLGADEVRRFLLHLEAAGRSPGTRAVYHAALTFLFTQTLGKPEIMAPTPRPRVRTQRPGRSLTRNEARRFLGALAHRPFDYTFFGLILATGLRLSEAVAVCVQDIDRSAGLLHVRKGKGGKSRSVMLSPRTLRLLERYWRVLGPPGPHLFPARERLGTKNKPRSWVKAPVSKWTMGKRLQRLRVPGLGRIRSHDLRRTFATWLLEETGDLRLVQVLLGHTSPQTTARYAMIRPDRIARTLSPFDRL